MEAVSSVLMARNVPIDGEATPPDWPRHLGDVLYLEMRKRGWTEDQVANHFGVAQSSVSRWMKGTTRPRGQRVNQVATFCGIDMAQAFRLNYRAGELETESVGLAVKVRALEDRLVEISSDMRDMLATQRVTTEALAMLTDVLREARDRSTITKPQAVPEPPAKKPSRRKKPAEPTE